MNEHEWIKEFPAALTVCDPEGTILEMNDKAAKTFESDGGYALIGRNMLDCHPLPARAKTEHLLAAREKNVYTIEKKGIKKLIYTEHGHFLRFFFTAKHAKSAKFKAFSWRTSRTSRFKFANSQNRNLWPLAVYQSLWFRDGQYAGFVELSLEIPFEMEHFVRQ